MTDLFPAQAGVIPNLTFLYAMHLSVPRASGGDPISSATFNGESICSPRKRG